MSARNHAAAEPDQERENVPDSEVPALYFPACGALCDAFWWARPAPRAKRRVQPADDKRRALDRGEPPPTRR